MLRLILTGTLAALFFSSTFVLTRAMSLEGGHWLWTASLRFGWMLVLLFMWLYITGRAKMGRQALLLYRRHFVFWDWCCIYKCRKRKVRGKEGFV